VEFLPDLNSMSDEELRQTIVELTAREHQVSYERRVLQGQIDLLRAEVVARRQKDVGQSVLDDLDVDRLAEILVGKVTPPE
jgi:hypothetical protein